MNGVWIDRPRQAWEDEGDGAFLERLDLLVMAEWSGRRREEKLQRLRDDYAVRAEFLLILQDLLAIRRATGCIAQLPNRPELEMLLRAVRTEQLEPRPHEPAEAKLAEDGWELPEEEGLPEWDLESLTPSLQATPDRTPPAASSAHPGLPT